MGSWFTDLGETFRNLNITDMIDMIVMACLIYFLLLWFKRTRAAFVARGIFIFALLYAIAQQSGMYLTTWMFQGFFAIALIAIVVIFQEELRSFFERIAVWSVRRRSHPLQPEEVEILVRMISQFARERIGALIVLKGRDPLERHVEGGEELDGKVSEGLLESLFDPHSKGHDGAVVIENDRVVSFGVHLPLSKEFRKLSHVGTRHAAALGLSERVDALCIVVSEERGTISLARNGYMSEMENLEALEKRLANFFKDIAPGGGKERLRWWQDALRNPVEKFIAVTISCALWLVLAEGYSPSREVFRVPVQARTVPDQFRIQTIRPSRVNIALKGLQRDLKLLNPLQLRVFIDPIAPEGEEGSQTITITEENVRFPRTLQLGVVDPPTVTVELTREKGKPFLFFSSKKEKETKPVSEVVEEPKVMVVTEGETPPLQDEEAPVVPFPVE